MNIFEQVRISRARATFLHARIDLKIREILEKFTMPIAMYRSAILETFLDNFRILPL